MSEDRTQPIRDLLGAMNGQRVERPRLCGGAMLALTRKAYAELRRSGVQFVTDLEDLPGDGVTRGDARVDCGATVMSNPGDFGYRVEYATCATCAGLEIQVRKALAEGT